MLNNGGMDVVRSEKDRKKYWSGLIDIGVSLSVSCATLLIGYQNGGIEQHKTALAMAITAAIGLSSHFTAMGFPLGSKPNAVFATVGACSNAMLFSFMYRRGLMKPTEKFGFVFELWVGGFTLFVILFASWASVRVFLHDVGSFLQDVWAIVKRRVGGMWRRSGMGHAWASFKRRYGARLGAVNKTHTEEELESAETKQED